jgi:hypothetical protein
MKEQVELLKQTYLGKCADFMVNPQPVLIRDIDTHLLNEYVAPATATLICLQPLTSPSFCVLVLQAGADGGESAGQLQRHVRKRLPS